MKKLLFVGLTLFCSMASSPREASDRTIIVKPEPKPARVGHIFIFGNERTQGLIILDQIWLYPGAKLSQAAIRESEKNLARLNIFKRWPTIIVQDNPNNPDSEYKDVLIKVEEDDTGRASLQCGFNSKGDWVIDVVAEERNLDPLNFPASSADLKEGRAFRGAGWAVGMSFALKVPVGPVRAPSVSLGIKLPGFAIALP